MADDQQQSPGKKSRIRKVETVRERAEKAQIIKEPRRHTRVLRKAGSTAVRPIKAARLVGQKEFYPVKVRESGRPGKFLNKRRNTTPSYFSNAWSELRQVVWPTNKETIKLTWAVYVFAIVFGIIIALTDYGIENLLRRILLR